MRRLFLASLLLGACGGPAIDVPSGGDDDLADTDFFGDSDPSDTDGTDDDAPTDSDPGDSDPGDADPSDDDPTDSDDGDTDGGDTDGGDGDEPEPEGPTRYPVDTLISPFTSSVAERLRAIASVNPTRTDDVFMKVGASGTVSHNLLYCFAGDEEPEYTLNLDGRDDLLPSIEYFRGGDAAGTTPFNRATLAALSGRSASWAISGDPSPVEQEIEAINPRFAFVNYGTNDMGLGATYSSALPGFYENMSRLLDQLEGEGIVPIVSGLNPRTDSAGAARWVPTYDAVTRGLAEARQLPYISLYYATRDLPNSGLLADGIHGNVYNSGGAQPCVFTSTALAYNYNVRNLLTMETLDITKRLVLDDESAPDSAVPHVGEGTSSSPIVIDTLPFTHHANTDEVGERLIDEYTGCSATQDESGPEIYYRLELEAATPVRAIVLDRANVDIDVHLLEGSPTAASCETRADRIIDRTLAAGTWYFSLDTYVPSSGIEQRGAYLLVVLRCEAVDPDC